MPKGLINFACQKKGDGERQRELWQGQWLLDKKGLGPSNAKAGICLVIPRLHCWFIAKQESPLGRQNIPQAEKQMQELWIMEGLTGPNPGKKWCLWVRKGLQVPWVSLHAHIRELGIHGNTHLTGGQLITSAAVFAFNICVQIYLTSAEHPKKIFKDRMGNPAAFWVHQISHTPFFKCFQFCKTQNAFCQTCSLLMFI